MSAALRGAQWQRCRTHYLRNLLAKVPKSAQPWAATLEILSKPRLTGVNTE